ncbi:MAG: hypothetical protein KDC14_15300, partial [Planctomycetes bacterium]|nr:hypothetical protein [Planctomycetota bacterium]
MSRLLSGLLACSLLLAFSGDAAAQRRLPREDAPAARCPECGAQQMDRQRAGQPLERRMVRRQVDVYTRRDRAPFAGLQREGFGGRQGDARGGEGRGRRGDARGGQGRGRGGDARGGEGRGRRGERGGEGRGRDSERARKLREKLR